jgi:hypothetical protein
VEALRDFTRVVGEEKAREALYREAEREAGARAPGAEERAQAAPERGGRPGRDAPEHDSPGRDAPSISFER